MGCQKLTGSGIAGLALDTEVDVISHRGNIVAADEKDQRYVGFLVPWLWRSEL
jgi:hypothetical protein